ncbi:MAG: ATP-binding cassette domain-containing protein [Treponema sp.]|jgi:simple sugar transport system ATP-binding protein|nr:ATP-binding cassette domain-containing protein [Treponema sp.]
MKDNTCYTVSLKDICKQYPGKEKKANNKISLNLKNGEILCIAGENGAGKTTLMKILCGLETLDSGEIFINGKNEKINSPLAAKKLGIGMVHQHFMLFPEFTVAQNIVMGTEPCKLKIFYDKKKAKEISDKIIKKNDFQISAKQKVKDLTLGQMQQVEICRILNANAQIIILDEPSSILTEQETDSLFKMLKDIVSEGKSVILITHKINEIEKIANRVAVLRKGELIGVKEISQTDKYEITRMMMGEDIPLLEKTQKEEKQNDPVLVFKNVTIKRKGQKQPLLDKVSFTVHSGEILGFTGVRGNGLGVIEAVLGGFLHPQEGKIFHRGKDISMFNIRKLRKQGLAYVPADRIRVASAEDATIEENIIITRRHDFKKGILLDKKEINRFFTELVQKYNIEGVSLKEKCSVLSGGNLQKLILAREINCIKDYIVFSEPSWGLDVASSGFIKSEILSLQKRNAAIILLSTNLDETLELADRIIVMYKGTIAGVFDNTKDNSIREKIGGCMQGILKEAG